MNPKYDTKLKVKDMEGEEFQLVQSEFDIRQFNAEYQEDFTYISLSGLTSFRKDFRLR